jgi:hypothetical protein
MNLNPAGAVKPGTARWHPPVVSCPTCGEDLQDEAFSLWCSRCQASVSFASVAVLGGDDA